MIDRLAMAAYAACYRRYGHPIGQHPTAPLETVWTWLSEEQREMWRDVAQGVVEAAKGITSDDTLGERKP